MRGASEKSMGPLETARLVLSRATRMGVPPGVELEAYVGFGRSTEVKVFAGRVESVSTAEPRGVGVRVIDGGRVGYSYSADLSDSGIDRVIMGSLENARVSEVDGAQGLPLRAEGYPVLSDLCSPGVSAMGTDAKIAIALKAEAAALADETVHIVEVSEYSDGVTHTGIASTRGVEVEGGQSFCFTYALALAGERDEVQSGLGFTMGRDPTVLQPEAAGAEAAAKARALLGAEPCPTGSYTVVFDRETAAALLGTIAATLNAEAIQKGRSVFCERMGTQVASPLVTLWDDGLAIDGPATSPFDGEGVPQQTTLLILDGTLTGVLHNTYTARRESPNTRSSGNAARGSYRVLPAVGPTNLVLQDGHGGLSDLLQRVGTGLYVENIVGLHSGVNPVTGEVSVGVTGRLIEGGAAGRPVREVTVATDFISLLGSVQDVAADSRWTPFYGSVCSPSIAVADVAVSGRTGADT
jgi:PmbA protein